MHYYKFNVKDWTRDTAHLTVVEEGIYRRLLDHYYESEKPIPTETQSVIRRLRLGGYESEVKAILDEFFQLSDDGYCHARCDDEIAKYHAKADANRGNGRLGGRPSKPKNNPDGFEKEPTDNLNHKPLTTNQEKDINTSRSLRVSDLVKQGVDEQVAKDWLTIRKAKRAPLTQTALDGVIREAGKAGIDLPAAILICTERNWQSFKAEWLTNKNEPQQPPRVWL